MKTIQLAHRVFLPLTTPTFEIPDGTDIQYCCWDTVMNHEYTV